MPELPEVESLTRQVEASVMNHTVKKIDFYRDDIRDRIDKKNLRKFLVDEAVQEVKRRGKYMMIATKKGAVGIHLGMSGKFIIESSEKPLRKHTHVVFKLEKKNKSVYYHFVDPRRFGRVFPLSSDQYKNFSHPFLADLGVEPLEANINLAQHLFNVSRNKKAPIKNFIMDSGIVVGVGNIYAAESLWRARILPIHSANKLSLNHYKTLAKEIKFILQGAIDAGGTTFRDYRNGNDLPGDFQNKLSVYDREGLPCPRCKHPVVRLIQAGRSSFFCQNCQL